MVIRPIDAYGDMMPVQTLSQMKSGAPAIAQAIKHRTNMMYGEWWEDETLGFRIPQFLAQGARRQDTGMLSQYISKYVSDTPGVTGVSAATVTYENHEMNYKCMAYTREGKAVVEVDLNGVL